MFEEQYKAGFEKASADSKEKDYSFKKMLVGNLASSAGEAAGLLTGEKLIGGPLNRRAVKNYGTFENKLTPEMQKVFDASVKKYPNLNNIPVGKSEYSYYRGEDPISGLARKHGIKVEGHGIYLGSKDPAVFAHELGHASAERGGVGGKLIRSIGRGKAVGALAAMGLMGHEDTRDYAPIAGVAGYIPELAEEGRASLRGRSILKETLSRPEYIKAMKTLSTYYGTYLYPPLVTAGAIYGAGKLMDAWK